MIKDKESSLMVDYIAEQEFFLVNQVRMRSFYYKNDIITMKYEGSFLGLKLNSHWTRHDASRHDAALIRSASLDALRTHRVF